MKEQSQLVRGLTPSHAGALVVGTVIGTGIFLKAGIMSQTVGDPRWMPPIECSIGCDQCGRPAISDYSVPFN